MPRKALIRFLTREKAQEFLLRIADRAATLLDNQQAEMSLRVRAKQDPQGAAARRDQFRESVEGLRRTHQEISESLQRRAALALPGHLEHPLASLCAEVRTFVTMELESCLSHTRLFRRHPWLELDAKVRADCTSRLRMWLSERHADFGRLMQEILGDDLERLRRLPDEVVRTCFELFGLHPSGSADAHLRDDARETEAALFAESPDFPWTARPRWWFYFLPHAYPEL